MRSGKPAKRGTSLLNNIRTCTSLVFRADHFHGSFWPDYPEQQGPFASRVALEKKTELLIVGLLPQFSSANTHSNSFRKISIAGDTPRRRWTAPVLQTRIDTVQGQAGPDAHRCILESWHIPGTIRSLMIWHSTEALALSQCDQCLPFGTQNQSYTLVAW